MKKGCLSKVKDFMTLTSAAVLTGGVASLLPQVVALADDKKSGFGFGIDEALEGAEANAALETVTTTVKSTGTSIYKIVFFTFVFIAIIGIVAAAIKIITSNAQGRQEAKSDVVWKVIGVVIGFAAVGAVTLLATIGSKLF